jgi:hypothetical protein
MEHTKIAATVGILLVVILGMFVFTYLKKTELEQETHTTPISQVDVDGVHGGITRIDGKHFYVAPNHTVVGEVLMPTPCDLLNWDVRVEESMPETAIIDFTVVNHAEVCAQVLTPQRFSVSFDASADAHIRATLEGRSIELNLVPALPGERPEDFELFIKG